MASPNITEIATAAIESRTGKLADNVLSNNALLLELKNRGRVKPFSGGTSIRQELQYAENATYTRYSGYDVINVSPSDVISSADFTIRQCAVAVTMSGLEMLQNSGKEQVLDLLESRIENAESTMMNNMSADVYSDGTATNQINGLQALVADAGTGTVGGINSSTYTFWQNATVDASTITGSNATSGNMQDLMNRAFVQVVRGPDRPNFIVADNNYWRLYLESLQSIQRIAEVKSGEVGFLELRYMGAPVVLDGGFQNATSAGGAPSNHMYFLNTKYLFLRPHSKRNMVMLEPDRFAVNQDAFVKIIGWAGNLTTSNRSLQCVLKA